MTIGFISQFRLLRIYILNLFFQSIYTVEIVEVIYESPVSNVLIQEGKANILRP